MSSETIAIPLRDVLNLGPLSEAVVLGGSAGLDRIVTTVTVMETDDAFRKVIPILWTTDGQK